jgi:hypothetical protein
MEFINFKKGLKEQFHEMIKDQDKLFLTDISRDELWDNYLNSFPEGTNLIYKERPEFDCNSCKQFIRPYGNIVTINNNELVSVWDIKGLEHPFDKVAESMSNFIKSKPIKNVFVAKERSLGVDKNRQMLEDGKTITWEHFCYKLPKSYIDRSSDSIESVQGRHRDSKNVFRRSMDELTIDSGRVILELIDQGSLYRGEEYKKIIDTFLLYKGKYDEISEDKKDNWCWINSFDNPISRVRNTAIGTLLIDLSEGVDIDVAVTKFEKVMAPSNYKRPKAIFTKKMVEDAENKIEELGFTDSLGRRFAQLKDITVNNLIFVNRDAKKKLKNSVFDDLKEDVPDNTKKFDKVEEVSIVNFITHIVPMAKNIELMVENRHNGNLMSLVAPEHVQAPTMFKWNNNFSWAYNGDITDSAIKKNVEKAGGNIEAVLRFSIQWNTGEWNKNDFDAHCIEPNRNLIYFDRMRNIRTSGELDVDIINPINGEPAVENIVHTNIDKMLPGKYIYQVHCYAHRGGRTGFSAEIEFDGQIYSYEYARELKQDEKVTVAEIEFHKETGIKFIKSLNSSMSTKQIWGINTNKFHKVNVCMLSPNYWDDQNSGGNKHYFFFLDGCINETTPRGFFNEFLSENLMQHRKVFEALGSKIRVKNSDEQLSGLGFSSTQRNSILAKVEGSYTKTIKIIF